MADEAQVIYEYTAGNTISFKTNNLRIKYDRLFMKVTARPDGKVYVNDPGKAQRTFSCSAIITGATMNTLNTVQTGSITYDSTYPRLTTIYFAGGTTITNIEVVVTELTATDAGNGYWNVDITFVERLV
jgi:hypothetical protein